MKSDFRIITVILFVFALMMTTGCSEEYVKGKLLASGSSSIDSADNSDIPDENGSAESDTYESDSADQSSGEEMGSSEFEETPGLDSEDEPEVLVPSEEN